MIIKPDNLPPSIDSMGCCETERIGNINGGESAVFPKKAMIAVILANDSTLGINPKGNSASAFRMINRFKFSVMQQKTVEPSFFINIGTHNFTMIIDSKRHGFQGTRESDWGIDATSEKESCRDTVSIKLNADDMTTVVDAPRVGLESAWDINSLKAAI